MAKCITVPVSIGRMGMTNITSISFIECQTSKKVAKNLVDKIKNQND